MPKNPLASRYISLNGTNREIGIPANVVTDMDQPVFVITVVPADTYSIDEAVTRHFSALLPISLILYDTDRELHDN